MKHTEGSWEVEERYSPFEVDILSNGKRICTVKSFDGKDFNDPTKEEADANAKLISAAIILPELLHALNVYLNAGSKEQRRNASIIAKKAIKKASSYLGISIDEFNERYC